MKKTSTEKKQKLRVLRKLLKEVEQGEYGLYFHEYANEIDDNPETLKNNVKDFLECRINEEEVEGGII